MKINLPSLVGIVLLVVGVFAGVALVQSSQDIRNKAAELKEHKATICHNTGSDSNPWNQIEVSENAVDAHLAHGDIRGNCPNQDDKNKGDDNKDKNKDNNSGGSSSSGGTTIANNITVNNNTSEVSGDSVETEIKYVYVNSRIDFWTKLFGIDKKSDNRKYRVIFRAAEDELHIYNNVVAASDPKGIFKSTITDIRPGTFELLVKPEGYLQKKFANILISRGLVRYHFEDRPFIPGDFNGDNDVDSEDIAELASLISENPYPEVENRSLFDINSDGKIDNEDMKLVLENYSGLVLQGDE